jgi:hypothetical protein
MINIEQDKIVVLLEEIAARLKSIEEMVYDPTKSKYRVSYTIDGKCLTRIDEKSFDCFAYSTHESSANPKAGWGRECEYKACTNLIAGDSLYFCERHK